MKNTRIINQLTFQILKLLKGDKCVDEWVNYKRSDLKYDSENLENIDDEVYPNSSAELHLSIALLDVVDDTTSYSSSVDQSNSLSSEEF